MVIINVTVATLHLPFLEYLTLLGPNSDAIQFYVLHRLPKGFDSISYAEKGMLI